MNNLMHMDAADHFYNEGELEMARSVSCGDVEAIKKLIAAGMNPNFVSATDMTPLQWACIKERMESLEALLGRGADRDLHAPLILCAQICWLKGAAALLLAGANPNLCDADDYTPLHMAVMRAGDDGASDDARAIVRLLLDSGANPWNGNSFKRTPLLIAIELGAVALFEQMAEKSALLPADAAQAEKIREECARRGVNCPF